MVPPDASRTVAAIAIVSPGGIASVREGLSWICRATGVGGNCLVDAVGGGGGGSTDGLAGVDVSRVSTALGSTGGAGVAVDPEVEVGSLATAVSA
jgi:hypothetical protein